MNFSMGRICATAVAATSTDAATIKPFEARATLQRNVPVCI